MPAKDTAKNQPILPNRNTAVIDAADHFDMEASNSQIVLTPVRIQSGDLVRSKLAELNLQKQDVADAVVWARRRATSIRKRSP
jgi:hypothetical protein